MFPEDVFCCLCERILPFGGYVKESFGKSHHVDCNLEKNEILDVDKDRDCENLR
jgi:hypothetical protein